MSCEDVVRALEKGTVIFNAYGAHVPNFAGPCLAATDATNTPNAFHLYLTKRGRRRHPNEREEELESVRTSVSPHGTSRGRLRAGERFR